MKWGTLDRKRRRKQEKPKPTAEQLGAHDSGTGGSLMVQWEAFRIACRRHGIEITRYANPHDPIEWFNCVNHMSDSTVNIQWDPVAPEWCVYRIQGGERWARDPGSRIHHPII